ncbi:hypothetical protein BCD64_07295 [Nostoc sp. MBR 210]|nr:hypothetical protein BCD64_07295 [Nostoc sp. MBR 210]
MAINVVLYSPGLGYINRGFESLTREIYQALAQEDIVNLTLFQGTGEVLPGAIPIWAPKRNAKFYDSNLIKNFKYRQYFSYTLENLFFSLPVVAHCYQHPCDVVYFSDNIPADCLHFIRKYFGGSFKLLFCNGAPASPTDYMRYDYVQVMTPAQYQEAIEAGYPQHKLFLIPQGLNCHSFSLNLKSEEIKKQKKQWNLPVDKYIVLSVGAINLGHKRMNWLIEEFSRLDPNTFFLWMVGQHEKETPYVKALAASKLKSNTYKFDVISYSEISLAYAVANCFVLCSLNEGFGRVYIEAMASELPVIAHRNVNTEWILGDKNLGLIDMTKSGELENKIIYFYQQKNTALNQGYNNQTTAFQKFDWASLHSQYIDMLRDISRI